MSNSTLIEKIRAYEECPHLWDRCTEMWVPMAEVERLIHHHEGAEKQENFIAKNERSMGYKEGGSAAVPDTLDTLNDCPYPETVYLAHPHIDQNINGHKQIVGMFLTDKPTGGSFYEYKRIGASSEIPVNDSDIQELLQKLETGNFYKDYDRDWELVGKLKKHLSKAIPSRLDDAAFRRALEKWRIATIRYASDTSSMESKLYCMIECYLKELPKREICRVKDIDAEIAIAEGIQKIPKSFTYEEFGTPVLKHLKSLGYQITKIEDGSSNEV